METSRNIFLSTCENIFLELKEFNFRALEKCQRLKKISTDKDLIFEIYFQSSFRNTNDEVVCIPHIHIFSKKVKKWKVDFTKNKYEKGYICGANLAQISQMQKSKTWYVTAKNQDTCIREIVHLIKKFVFPVFDFFENTDQAARFLGKMGSQVTEFFTPEDLKLFGFVFLYGGPETAANFLNKEFERSQNGQRKKEFFLSLDSQKKIDTNDSEFVGADELKIAYLLGVKLKKIPV